jgi:hypothetical protein
MTREHLSRIILRELARSGPSIFNMRDALTDLVWPVVAALERAITEEDPFEWADQAVAAFTELAEPHAPDDEDRVDPDAANDFRRENPREEDR